MSMIGNCMNIRDLYIELNNNIERCALEIIDLVARLVAARSDNPPGDTREPAAIISDFLTARGLVVDTVARTPEKPNLVARATGHRAGPHLVLNGHLDTVRAGNEADWSVPPFAATRKNGRVYGLGAGNMKGGLAALAFAFAWLAARPQQFSGTLSFTAVADETVFGPDGAGYLIEQRPDLLGDALICGEGPGGMDLAIAEKGLLWVELTATAPSAQGMLMRRGGSAITRLAAALVDLDALNDEQTMPPAELACLAAHAGEHGLRSSLNVGRIEGGSFVSQVATGACAEIDVRIPPGLSIADIEGRIAAVCNRHDLAWRRIKGWEPNWTPPTSPIARAVARAAAQARGTPPRPVVRLPASDASRWRARGIPSVCFGPQPDLVSGTDDHVEERDVIDCAKIYVLAALDFLGADR